MNSKRTLALLFILATAPALALAQEGGGGSGSGGGGGSGGHGEGGGGSGCGDVFGDLVHILRHSKTGQPILQKRWVELPKDAGFGWAYCPIAVDANGDEIGFVPDSCDYSDPDSVVAVDYFGRLSGGRTKERNSRMHFDEVISSIKDAGWVGEDETGRLALGFECSETGVRATCAEFSMIDSPMENLALYTRLMKYGHLQTDPMEVDTWEHGDPAAGTRYHPALDENDWRKFDGSIWHLLPGNQDPEDYGQIPTENCFSGGFIADCAKGESLHRKDFFQAASYLSGAANKTGKITVDLVQYMNRILKITLTTEMSSATVDTLPALIRDCGDDNALDNPAANGNCAEPYPAAGLPAPANERFVKFDKASYVRNGRYNELIVNVLQDEGGGTWTENDVGLAEWLNFVAELDTEGAIKDINGFVQAASDGLRTIEFVHNYAIPEDLWSLYAGQEP